MIKILVKPHKYKNKLLGLINKNRYDVILAIPGDFEIPPYLLSDGEYVDNLMEENLKTLNGNSVSIGPGFKLFKLNSTFKLDTKRKTWIIDKVGTLERYNKRCYCPGVTVLKKRVVVSREYIIHYPPMYHVILVISSGTLIPDRYKKYIKENKNINLNGYITENNENYIEKEGDVFLVLKHPYIISPKGWTNRWELYDKELEHKLGLIKNYNSHDNT